MHQQIEVTSSFGRQENPQSPLKKTQYCAMLDLAKYTNSKKSFL